jgi:hypothetical protein
MAATKLSNRLDIGSPPFCKSGTCRAATIADPRALDKRGSGPRGRDIGSRRENGHSRARASRRPEQLGCGNASRVPRPRGVLADAPSAVNHARVVPAGYSSSEYAVPLPSIPPRSRRFRFHFPPLIFMPGRRGPVMPRLFQSIQGKEVRWQQVR